jgi:hypothetical protein
LNWLYQLDFGYAKRFKALHEALCGPWSPQVKRYYNTRAPLLGLQLGFQLKQPLLAARH